MSDAANKVVAVTGGASGIGAATRDRLWARGAQVYVLDVAPPEHPDVHYLPCDLSDANSIAEALAQLPQQLHALVNVAGVAAMPDPIDTVAINFLGLRQCCEALLPRLQDGGSIVNVASTAGWRWREHTEVVNQLLETADYAQGLSWLKANESLWRDEPYHFSKRCAAAYTYRATELALTHGVRVNCVNPGVTETRLSPAFREMVGDKLYDWGVEQIGRPGTPDDIAEVVDYLAVGDCRWLNGQEIVVDGGYIAGLIGGWIDPSRAPT